MELVREFIYATVETAVPRRDLSRYTHSDDTFRLTGVHEMPSLRLKSVSYTERDGQDLFWSLEGLELGSVNLLVGKNATGKTRVLTLIANLANSFLQDGKIAFDNGSYDARFEEGGGGRANAPKRVCKVLRERGF